MKFLITLIAFSLISSSLFAGECVIKINRTPCPGEEAKALKPYNNVNPTSEVEKKATTPEACTAAAEKDHKIKRKGTLAKKITSATFDGKEVFNKTDEVACK